MGTATSLGSVSLASMRLIVVHMYHHRSCTDEGVESNPRQYCVRRRGLVSYYCVDEIAVMHRCPLRLPDLRPAG